LSNQKDALADPAKYKQLNANSTVKNTPISPQWLHKQSPKCCLMCARAAQLLGAILTTELVDNGDSNRLIELTDDVSETDLGGKSRLARDRQREHLDVVGALLTCNVEGQADVSNTDALDAWHFPAIF
jgi:hypothetical protein